MLQFPLDTQIQMMNEGAALIPGITSKDFAIMSNGIALSRLLVGLSCLAFYGAVGVCPQLCFLLRPRPRAYKDSLPVLVRSYCWMVVHFVLPVPTCTGSTWITTPPISRSLR